MPNEPAQNDSRRTTGQVTAFLARWRVASGFLFGALVYWVASPSRTTLAAGAVIAGIGEALRIWAAGHLHKSREVTTTGPYRWVAHPLYVGSSVVGAGLAVASGSLVVAALIALYLSVALTAAARQESAYLSRTFGEEYDRYRRGDVDGAGRSASGSAARPEGASRRFSLARAVANHEHRALIGLLLAALLLALKVGANV